MLLIMYNILLMYAATSSINIKIHNKILYLFIISF